MQDSDTYQAESQNGENPNSEMPNDNFNELGEGTSDEVKLQKSEYEKIDLSKLQNKFVPPKIENREMKLTDEDYNILSQTQLSDTNNVVIKIPLNKIKTDSDFGNYKYLQEKYIPSQKENLLGDTLGSTFFTGSSTQPSDTNVVEAWFTNDKIISKEYDPRYLQKQYIPTDKDTKKLE